MSVSVNSPLIGDPERQPVSVFPAVAAPFEFGLAALGAAWLGASFPGAFEAGPVCAGWVLGLAVDGLCVCGSAGVVVCVFVPEGLWVCAGAEPEDDALSGVVLWAATQHADSSNKENNVALDFIRIRRLPR